MKAHDGPEALTIDRSSLSPRLRAIDAPFDGYVRLTEDPREETAQRAVEGRSRWRRVDRDRFGEARA